MLFGRWGKKIAVSGGRKGKKYYSPLLRESGRANQEQFYHVKIFSYLPNLILFYWQKVVESS